MNRKLAERLRDAGFPKVGSVEITFKEGLPDEELWFPKLSDIIEACGDIEITLHKQKGTHIVKYHAFMGDGTEFSGHGESFEEAVSNLWLALKQSKASSVS